MDADTAYASYKARTMDFANRGIRLQAEGNHLEARLAWADALAYAERNLPGDNIIFWIRSGLGDSLLLNGDYLGAIDMAASALEFCASVKAPLAALTMAKAYLRVGDVTRAKEYARMACELKGPKVLEVFTPADQVALNLKAAS